MRFRAKLVDIGCIQHFTRVVGTLAKISKTCVFRLTLEKIYFILAERMASGGIRAWCELIQGHFFNEYNMDGVSEEANEIYLEFSPESLFRSLKTAQNAKSVKMKLTKKHTPCITLEVELPSISGCSRIVVHDLPVDVVPQRLWDEFEEPEMPKFTVSIYMPNLRTLRNISERMKNLSNYVTLSANLEGDMKLSVEADLFNVSTHFQDLEYPNWGDGTNDESRDPSEFAEARIDIRKFVLFLAGQQVNPSRVICNIEDNRTVHFLLLHEDLSIQFFLPVVSI